METTFSPAQSPSTNPVSGHPAGLHIVSTHLYGMLRNARMHLVFDGPTFIKSFASLKKAQAFLAQVAK